MTIENVRLVLVVVLSFIAMLLWDAWQRDYGKVPTPIVEVAPTLPSVRATDSPPLPAVAAVPVAPTAPPTALASPPSQQPILVETDVFSLEINPAGGTFQKLRLRKFPESVADKKRLFALLDQSATRDFIAQSGLKSRPKPQKWTKCMQAVLLLTLFTTYN